MKCAKNIYCETFECFVDKWTLFKIIKLFVWQNSQNMTLQCNCNVVLQIFKRCLWFVRDANTFMYATEHMVFSEAMVATPSREEN